MVDLIERDNIDLIGRLLSGNEQCSEYCESVASVVDRIASKIFNELAVDILRAFDAHAIDVSHLYLVGPTDVVADFAHECTFAGSRGSTDVQAPSVSRLNAFSNEAVQLVSLTIASNEAPWLRTSGEQLTRVIVDGRNVTRS